MTVELGVKLVPDTVTREPTGPVIGLRLMPGVSVNVVDAECEKASVAVTVWGPPVPAGTVSDAVNAPIVLVLELPIAMASKVTVIAEEPEKPVPVTVNDEPTMPLAGVKVMKAVTVNEAVAV